MKVSTREPVRALTATLRYGDKVLRDDGSGRLRGDGIGHVNYRTGDMLFLPVDPDPSRQHVTAEFQGLDGRQRELHLVPIEKMKFHSCPVCGKKAVVLHEDEWKCRKISCNDHGEFTVQG